MNSPSAIIQYMPPGRRKIFPGNLDDPVEVEILPELVFFLDYQLQNLRSAGAAARAFPFGCVDHRDDTIAFEAVEFTWAGGGPLGGVHLRVHWTAMGLAVLGAHDDVAVSPKVFCSDADQVKTFFKIVRNVGSLVTLSASGSLPVKRAGKFLSPNRP
jgi:hypothetical protein